MLDMEIIEPEILELEPQGNIPRIESDFNNLYNKPSIEGIELVGNLRLTDLNAQPKGEYAQIRDIPTKTSQLTNDSNFINEHQDISNLATKGEINNKADRLHTHNELHIHSNRSVLDNITQKDIDKWNTQSGSGSGESNVTVITKYDKEMKYEDNEVYNSNAMNQILDIFNDEMANMQKEINNTNNKIDNIVDGDEVSY